MKRLSVIVPTYNMEQLLPACLDSLVGSRVISALDVVVVNDGSKDSSLKIAQGYAAKYPDSVRVIDKPNGNYGSTINAALPTLKGEYVRILDSDDTFDSAALERYIEYLEQVSGADMVVGPYIEISHNGERKVEYDLYNGKNFGYGRAYDAERVFERGVIPFFMMHSIAYRTALLQRTAYHQREGISYTDQQWCFYPIFYVSSIAFTDIALYRYNLAREGQTMDSRVQIRRISELVTVVTDMAQYLDCYNSGLTFARYDFLSGVVFRRMQSTLRKYLLEMDDQSFALSDFEKALNSFTQLSHRAITVPVNGMLKIDLLKRWKQRGTRYSESTRSLLITLDNTMQRIYKLIFS